MSSKTPMPESAVERVLAALVVDPSKRQEINIRDGWTCQSVGHDKLSEPDVPIILVENGPKHYTEIVKAIRGKNKWIVLWSERRRIILKAPDVTHHRELENESDYNRIIKISTECKIAGLSGVLAGAAITEMIKKIKSTTDEFVNRGVFSTHYIKNRLIQNIETRIDKKLIQIQPLVDKDPESMLEGLGWNIAMSEGTHRINDTVSMVITKQANLSVRGGGASCPKLHCHIGTVR